METLSPINDSQLNCRSKSEENNDILREGNSSREVCAPTNGSSPSPSPSPSQPVDDSWKRDQYSDTLLQYISDLLMEDDFGNKPCMLQDSLALQATERSLYDALNNNVDENSDNSEQWNKTFGDRSDPYSSGVKKVRSREDNDSTEYNRKNKQSANINVDEPEPVDAYDDVLMYDESGEAARLKAQKKSLRTKGGGTEKNIIEKEFVDIKGLLIDCAEAASKFDIKALNDALFRVMQYSSPRGNGMERLAHYFSAALEARLAGTGAALYAALDSERISAAEIMRAYKMFVLACPFRQLSNIMANATIANLATEATTLHIIDFGILYGCQWPCIMHCLSKRPGGPPKLRITGIDFPQPGFRPAERVAETCRCLVKYAETFGVANGKYNSSFFSTRFKEALLHFSTMFDMFEATVPEDDEDRILFEQQFLGKEAMNIIACDGTERVERPETYKQWQARIVRAGFKQVPLDQDILKRVRKVKTGYHKSFSVDEDGKWVLVGWKGRVIQAFSCWRHAY